MSPPGMIESLDFPKVHLVSQLLLSLNTRYFLFVHC